MLVVVIPNDDCISVCSSRGIQFDTKLTEGVQYKQEALTGL